MKPAEGTILTVSRVAADAAQKAAKKTDDCEAVLVAAMNAARPALEETQNQNPVLKKAGVVDAGGYGYVIILQAMLDVVSGTITRIVRKVATHTVKPEMADFSQFDTEEITFAYCTEFIAKREDADRDPQLLRDFLETIGDCVVVVEDDEIVKVHVHTDTPDKALGEGMKYGHLLTVKVENMLEQHERKVADEQAAAMNRVKVAEPEKRYGFVAVAAGEGIVSLFRDLGADMMVEGGQTMNPSTEDILAAIDGTPAEVVFVLPNNKNIIMASEQAAELASKQVVVLPTKTIPQGISAMLAFDPEIDPENNAQTMNVASQLVHSGQMTYAARDSEFDGNPIKQGDYLALCEGKLHATGPDFFETMQKLAEGMCNGDSAFITILYGEGADEEQAQKVSEMFQTAAPNAEINVLEGGQPVYSYILSVE
jgi:DAK2 domain fusion protein YloV